MIIVASFVLTALPATAQQPVCQFSLSANKTRPAEGETVRVTVKGSTIGSSVDVVTSDDTAKAPGDYEPIKQTFEVTRPDSEMTLSTAIKDDTASEPEESFLVRMTNNKGCAGAVMTSGNPTRVNIQASDASGGPAKGEESPKGSPTPSASAPTSGAVAPSPSPPVTGISESPSASSPVQGASPGPALEASAKDEDGGIPALVVVAIVAAVVASAAGVGIWLLRRSTA